MGPSWCPKVSLAAVLGLGVCRWDHIVLGVSARSHVDTATLRRALERMDAAWQGEERMAKLSVNAMIGLRARSTEVVYSVRSSSSELNGAGADFSQAFAYEGGMVWDFVYVFLDIVSKFEPTILCDIRSWDCSRHCTEHSRARRARGGSWRATRWCSAPLRSLRTLTP